MSIVMNGQDESEDGLQLMEKSRVVEVLHGAHQAPL